MDYRINILDANILLGQSAKRYLLFALVLLISLGSCTNSKLLLKPLYGQLDNHLDRNFLDLVDLDNTQEDSLHRLTDAFHAWHRQSELPQYSTFLSSLADKLDASDEHIDVDFSERLILSTREFRETVFACHPANFSITLLKSLSSVQIDQMQRNYIEQQQQRRNEVKHLSENERVKKATQNAKKWMARANLELNAEQTSLLTETIREQKRPNQAFVEELDNWGVRFFNMLRQSHQVNFDVRFAQSILQRWRLFESANPEVCKAIARFGLVSLKNYLPP